MLLEEIVEIIEYTDSDHLSRAMEIFNAEGIVTDGDFPFMNVVFDRAPSQLIAKLTGIGFKGDIQIARCEPSTFVLFDAKRVQASDAVSWFSAR